MFKISTKKEIYPSSSESRPQPYKRYLFVPAFIVMSVIIFLIINPKPLEQTLIEDIVDDHLSNAPILIQTEDLSKIQSHLDRLNFTLTSPLNFPLQDWKILGDRYAELEGKLAAVIKIKDPKNSSIFSLYYVILGEELKQKFVKRVEQGVQIKIWQEQGVTFALAGPAQ